ncbi:Holliday junction branch migration protein RuvA [Sunxiuqinia elliptica]|uniref:Holliday junction branch migration complex subunit RuvA n=1 Tax=Sunxiuqinia elliptica TaxID=655355 RepID=A0A1I2CIJ1_9BACT|nr:Holliday junction branch migration protein RuvA [Sunxiuqinia elliptica]TDO03910.1 Holliday junction DNA helicase subunit RuvA [Sunxiuqinia elliptica]TDO62192.1 Holliday junction DNA helicase subunit RuvA [Sunxiuqinia elliptica]SFE68058.1 Holliday junction DNA helicase subunit RuvA [Sunxiuqinia elliptica]
MYEYIQGKITGLTPTNAIIEAGSIGYFINISLNTYSLVNGKEQCKLFLHQVVREDAHLLYGFAESGERELFRLLVSVNGIGSNTALMMLSSLSPEEIRKAILEENVTLLKSIKGIGAKTAQRVIIDLKDKIGKTTASDQILMTPADNTIRDEALSALVMLGFAKKNIEKELDKLLKANPDLTVEETIKMALKGL